MGESRPAFLRGHPHREEYLFKTGSVSEGGASLLRNRWWHNCPETLSTHQKPCGPAPATSVCTQASDLRPQHLETLRKLISPVAGTICLHPQLLGTSPRTLGPWLHLLTSQPQLQTIMVLSQRSSSTHQRTGTDPENTWFPTLPISKLTTNLSQLRPLNQTTHQWAGMSTLTLS